MTHKYPATLPAQAQEGIEDIVSRLHAYLVQREVAHKELERQNGQLSASLQAERAAHSETRDLLARREAIHRERVMNLRLTLRKAFEERVGLRRQNAELERQLEECRALLNNAASGGRDE